ncbi:winged helix-turn-helix domain-containing protein [Streptomyces sp. NPDC088748]|uniref:winged helix-turn-helix domain-containing protein n=1 Tax=Streptomyces sp. NPDC088748 TaxID=3365887 RepID=UPI00381B6370
MRVSLPVAAVRRLPKRHGWSWQAPARRALDRYERAVEWKCWPIRTRRADPMTRHAMPLC